jgi:hypothetical protein
MISTIASSVLDHRRAGGYERRFRDDYSTVAVWRERPGRLIEILG